MIEPNLADIRALAFLLAPSGQNRNPITGEKPTKADLARFADLVLCALSARIQPGVSTERLRELLTESTDHD